MTFGGNGFKLNGVLFSYGLSAKEISVYSYLSFCGGTRKACKVKISTIASACGCSKSTVRRALKSLQKRGMLEVSACAQELETGGWRQTCNRYYLLDCSEWREVGFHSEQGNI